MDFYKIIFLLWFSVGNCMMTSKTKKYCKSCRYQQCMDAGLDRKSAGAKTTFKNKCRKKKSSFDNPALTNESMTSSNPDPMDDSKTSLDNLAFTDDSTTSRDNPASNDDSKKETNKPDPEMEHDHILATRHNLALVFIKYLIMLWIGFSFLFLQI